MQARRSPFILPAVVIAIAMCAFAWNAGATSERASAQPTAIATIDIVAVFDGLDERQVLEDKLNTRTQARQEQLNEVVNQIQALQANLSEIADKTTPEYREQVRQLMELRAVAEARREALAQIISIDLGSVRRDMYLKVTAAIESIANREGYDMVMLDDSLFPLPENAADPDVYRAVITKTVVYRKDSIDITNQVITLMNNEFNAP
jgi:Skp family chaperone for outer membrane proteins